MTADSTFSRVDADRILRRAAEIEGSEDQTRMSVAELRSIAGEAGLGTSAVERAISEAQSTQRAVEVRQKPVQRWGLVVTHLSALREIPVQLNSAQLMEVVRLLHPYRDGTAQVKLEEQEMVWRDRKGIHFGVTSAGGQTHVRVYVSKFALFRRGRWTTWVKQAADRLESLVRLVGAGEETGNR